MELIHRLDQTHKPPSHARYSMCPGVTRVDDAYSMVFFQPLQGCWMQQPLWDFIEFSSCFGDAEPCCTWQLLHRSGAMLQAVDAAPLGSHIASGSCSAIRGATLHMTVAQLLWGCTTSDSHSNPVLHTMVTPGCTAQGS